MKINCACGHQIIDGADGMPNKARVFPDQSWGDVLDAIDAAIEQSGPTAAEKEAACMAIRARLNRETRLAWQCSVCAALYVDDARSEAWRFESETPETAVGLFRGKDN